MGYVLVTVKCASCPAIISCNPNHVPSIRINDEGPRQAICFTCAEKLNDIFEERGKPRIPIHPEAYKPEDENKVAW